MDGETWHFRNIAGEFAGRRIARLAEAGKVLFTVHVRASGLRESAGTP